MDMWPASFSPLAFTQQISCQHFTPNKREVKKEMKYNTLALQHSSPLNTYLRGIEISKAGQTTTFFYCYSLGVRWVLSSLLCVMHNPYLKYSQIKHPLFDSLSLMFGFLTFKETLLGEWNINMHSYQVPSVLTAFFILNTCGQKTQMNEALPPICPFHSLCPPWTCGHSIFLNLTMYIMVDSLPYYIHLPPPIKLFSPKSCFFLYTGNNQGNKYYNVLSI